IPSAPHPYAGGQARPESVVSQRKRQAPRVSGSPHAPAGYPSHSSPAAGSMIPLPHTFLAIGPRSAHAVAAQATLTTSAAARFDIFIRPGAFLHARTVRRHVRPIPVRAAVSRAHRARSFFFAPPGADARIGRASRAPPLVSRDRPLDHR